MEQTGRASLVTTIRNESLVGAVDSPTRAGASPNPAIGVVVICLPRADGGHDEALAGLLAGRFRVLDPADVVHTLATARYRCDDDSRALLTLLFTDIVGSTGMVDHLGDGAWRALLAQHNAIVRAQLTNFRGREVDHAGDGFFATFDRPTPALRCAQGIRTELCALGIVIRAAVHTSECETSGEFVTGVAVHVAARMVSVAKPGEIVVSNTVRELVAGSGLEFSGGEWRKLRGLSGRRQLFALKPETGPGSLKPAPPVV